MSPLKTCAPDASEMWMLCGAPSRLSKAMVKGLPAVTATAGVVNAMSLATTVAVPPAGTGEPAEAGAAGVPAGAAEAPEQAASTAASASRPRVRVRRFMSVGLLLRWCLTGRDQAPAAATPRRATSWVKAANSRRTTENGLRSWRAKVMGAGKLHGTSVGFRAYV